MPKTRTKYGWSRAALAASDAAPSGEAVPDALKKKKEVSLPFFSFKTFITYIPFKRPSQPTAGKG
jgi:hypothetical protein